jgi:hypothetical protein
VIVPQVIFIFVAIIIIQPPHLPQVVIYDQPYQSSAQQPQDQQVIFQKSCLYVAQETGNHACCHACDHLAVKNDLQNQTGDILFSALF